MFKQNTQKQIKTKRKDTIEFYKKIGSHFGDG